MMRNRGGEDRLAVPDPFAVAAEARVHRGPIVAAWLGDVLRAGGPGPGAPPEGRALIGLGAMVSLAAAYALSYLFRNVNGILGPEIGRDLSLSAEVMGLLTSVALLVFAAAQLPVGFLLDRYGPARVQPVLLLCAAVGSALSAAGTQFATLLVGRALIGLGTAGCLVAGLKAVSAWFPKERVATINGGLVMCGGFGALLATLPVDLALRFMDWRGLNLLLAVLAGAAALAIHALTPPVRTLAASASAPVDLCQIVRDPLLQRLAPLSASCFGAVLAIQGLWTSSWLSDIGGQSRAEVSSELACMAIVLIGAAPSWGLLTRWLRRRGLLGPAPIVATLALLGTETALIIGPEGASLIWWYLFAGFGGFSVLTFSIFAEHFPAASIGRANGALNVGHIGCSFLIQCGIGFVVGQWTPELGRYPASAYYAELMLPMVLQVLALLWFIGPHWKIARLFRRTSEAGADQASSG